MRTSKSRIIITMLVACFVLLSMGQVQANKVNWEAFSENLVIAIKSGHPGLQNSAMQQIIRYSDSLVIDNAVYPIVQIFRFNDNSRVRRLAMVALAKVNTDKAISYLYKYMKFEDNVAIKHQCCCIINDYCETKSPEKEQEIAALAQKL